MKLLDQCNLMLNQVRSSGSIPQTFLMNHSTAQDVAEEQQKAAEANRSALGRVLAAIRREGRPAPVQTLLGLPVTLRPDMPNGMIAMGVATPAVHMGQNLPSEPGKPMEEFKKREPVSEEKDAPTIADIAKGDGLTPSAIVMKSLEGIDDIRHIVIIRVHHNEDVDLCLSCDKFTAQGVLQKAQMYLVARD